jgi:hypothetical protein
VLIQDFCGCLERVLDELGLQNCPHKIWIRDKTGLMFVTAGFKVVTNVGKKYIYECVYTERGTITTV